MKRSTIIILVVTGLVIVPKVANPWTYSYGEDGAGDVGYCVQETLDSCYIVVGYTESFEAESRDLILIKVDLEGNEMWTRRYGTPGYDAGQSIQKTLDSCYVITGYVWENEFADVWLLKTDTYGDTLWTRSYGGDSNDYGNCVVQSTDGGYVVAGYTVSLGNGMEGYLIKTDSSGELSWYRTYGGEEDDYFTSVQQTSDGGYIVTGVYENTIDEVDPDLWLIKTDDEGQMVWQRFYGENDRGEGGYCVKPADDGGYVVFGNGKNAAAWLLKTNSVGDTLWTSKYYSPYTGAQSFDICSDGGYILTGEMAVHDYALFLIRTDPYGDTLWRRFYSNTGTFTTDCGYCVHQTADGGFIVAGKREDSTSYPRDLWLLKTNLYGDTVWYDFSPTDIIEPQEGGNYFSFIPLVVFTHLGTKTYEDLFYSYCEIMDLSDSSRIYIDSVPCIGSYRPIESMEIEFSEWTAPDTSEFEATFYARDSEGRELSSMPASVVFKWTGIGEEFIEHPSYYVTFSIGREVVLQYSNWPQGFSASVFDATGRKVADLQSAEPSGTITWGEDRSPGVYFVRVASEKSVKTQKVILIR